MRLFKKITCIIVMLSIFTTQLIFAEEITTTTKTPSVWATWDIQMAYTYGLGNNETYKEYNKSIMGNQFLEIESSFEEKFEITDETKVANEIAMTRGDVIRELFDLIQLTLKLEPSADTSIDYVLDYFVKNNLIKGRNNGDYALDKFCTNEEMLVLSKRVYDYLIYTLDLDSKGAFWKVSDEDNTVYLLGSIHAADGSIYPFSKDIINSFANSDVLAVEANVLVQNESDSTYLQQKMMSEGEVTIDQLISKETYDSYVTANKKIGTAPEVYNKLKPWFAAMYIQSAQLSSASYSSALGIDVYFLYLANNYKPIVELEGMKFQIDMFDSFTPELQEEYLLSVLEEEEISIELLGKMLTSWRLGDMEELEKQLFVEDSMTELGKEFTDKVLDTRNKNMLDKVEKMLTDDSENDYFVVVGAAHMLSDTGLVQGLTDLGYVVEQVK